MACGGLSTAGGGLTSYAINGLTMTSSLTADGNLGCARVAASSLYVSGRGGINLGAVAAPIPVISSTGAITGASIIGSELDIYTAAQPT